jgi:hypothetical protein
MRAQAADLDLPRAFRAMKFRYRTQAMLNLGFWLLETRPAFFFVAIVFFLVGGHRWLDTSQQANPHQLRSEAMGVVVGQRRVYLL